jgi:hypothetical protein
VDEYKFRIACAYNYRNIRAKSLQALIAWRHHFNEFIELRADIVKVFRFEHFLRRRFLAFRIIVTRERLLRRAVRRYCRKSIIIVFYRWLYQSRWLKYKLVSRTNVIIALRKNLMTQRLMKLNWRTIIKKKVRLESAKKIQRNFRLHARFRRTHARIVITRFVVTTYGYRLFCRRLSQERRRMDFESRAAHSYCSTALVRLDRYVYQNDGGIRMTAIFLKEIKQLLSEEGTKLKPGNRGASMSAIIPTPQQLPRIEEQWTTDGRILYVMHYRCAMEGANMGRRLFRVDNPPPYWCRICGHVSLLKCMAEYHSLTCRDVFGRSGRDRKPELISRAGLCYGGGFGGGYITFGLPRVLYDVRIAIPVPISKRQVKVKKSQRSPLKSLERYLKPYRSTEPPPIEWASDYEVEQGLVSITGSRLAKSDKPIAVAAGPLVYVDAGASISPDLWNNECWKRSVMVVSEVIATLESTGPPVNFHS